MGKQLSASYDWREVARLALTSRHIDLLQENKLSPAGLVTYQFSARGHELGQILVSQLLRHKYDAAGVYYRSRPFMLGTGLTVEEAMASDMARVGGVSRGRDVGVVFNMPRREGATVIPMGGDVGSQYTPTAGWAQALQYRHDVLGQAEVKGGMVVVFGGDGSVATNGFWASLTMATTLKLPMLFLIEDNGYAISVTSPAQTPGANIAENLASFKNLKIWEGNGSDPAEAGALVAEAIDYVRQWEGPAMLRLVVPRLSGHSGHDNQAYKSEGLLADERARDPLLAIEEALVPEVMSVEEWSDLKAKAEAAVEAATEAAKNQAEPAPAEAMRFVWAEADQPAQVGGLASEGIVMPAGRTDEHPPEPRRINMVEAVRRTLDVELELNDRVLVFGEDVGAKGGVHTATMGLQTKYGAGRVFDTSLSEEGIIGRAAGMAAAGLRPVPEIQFRKYADPAMEQINNCGTVRWRTANRFATPMVVRIPVGFGRKIGDPWHSVTSESIYTHAVGWQLAFPAHAADAVGLLRSALRSENPTIFFEHRAQLDAGWARRPYPGDEYVIPFGKAHMVTTGDELTVVTWGAMVERCHMAAEKVGAGVEVIDLRTLMPWDKEAVLASVRKTSRCLVVHEDIGVTGFGAEVAATVVAEAFLDLDAPVERLTMPAVPVPFNVGLMNAVLPTIEAIEAKMRWMLAF
ncbi:MAG TPA: transketolase C-terminal domain-containing protein [Anaerolineae bacterium]|nr:transketolase C-terminal domain-containing protein [Anaerolineae bacterium]